MLQFLSLQLGECCAGEPTLQPPQGMACPRHPQCRRQAPRCGLSKVPPVQEAGPRTARLLSFPRQAGLQQEPRAPTA